MEVKEKYIDSNSKRERERSEQLVLVWIWLADPRLVFRGQS
jgi:hypothetical protein